MRLAASGDAVYGAPFAATLQRYRAGLGCVAVALALGNDIELCSDVASKCATHSTCCGAAFPQPGTTRLTEWCCSGAAVREKGAVWKDGLCRVVFSTRRGGGLCSGDAQRGVTVCIRAPWSLNQSVRGALRA